MSELTDKISGAVNEVVGKAKQAVGGHTGDTELHDEGAAQEVEGKGENLKGKVKGVINDL